MQKLGISDYEMLNYEDGSLLQHTDCLENIDLTPFTKIFVTGMHDDHPDHTAACISVCQALKRQEITGVEIYQYEIHAPLQKVTHMIDITKTIEKKLSLIRCHQSQLTSLPYDSMAKSLARYRALQNRMKDCYIETYTYMNPTDELDSNTVELEKKLQKSVLFYWVLTRWMELKIRGFGMVDILKKLKYHNIAVYGYAELGQLLCKELADTQIYVSYLIDKKVKDTGKDNLPVYSPRKGLPEVDAVVVTAVYYFNEIEEELSQMGYQNIISLRTLLEIDIE